MKSFRIIGLIILGIIIAFFIGGFFLPTEVVVNKSVKINAPADTVYNAVVDFHEWENWSTWGPWADSAADYTITGENNGVGLGSVIRWKNDKDMVGERSIDSVIYPSLIKVVTRFREEGSTADIIFRFNKISETETEVSIHFDMNDYPFSYPFGRYAAWIIQKGAESSFPKALNKLKDYSERKQGIETED